ncbi:thiol protease/hemagglutinin PrtT [Barnesiella viscericola]|uniref:thiol protease/hemagglutinin PrtT n=1 Tax=Barnesiella viscericola TaxID=397865 RepID=UPI003208638C
MKKRFLLLSFCVFLVMGLCAKPRSLQEAQQIANSFSGNTGKTTDLKKGVKSTTQLAFVQEGASQPLYYVFNKGTGFVIVSADDRATEILGYSDAGSFDVNNLPDNFRFLLESYATELEDLSAVPETDAVPMIPVKASAQTGNTSVAPLLGNILWDQGDPYNNFCPTLQNGNKAAVGCVATAMSQIMGYYQWPLKGTGTIPGYTTRTNGFVIDDVNIDNTYYDWDHMTPFYNSESTAEEREAVALLAYHCGISVNMDYDSSSGAYSFDVPKALTTYFGYNENMEIYSRSYYTKAEWDSIIRNELDEGRPVYYSGQSTGGGHAFVCDGYDTNGLFHINWGWSGLSNGYFMLSDLTPPAQGTGGSNSGYNSSQSIIVGIQPQTMPEREEYQIYLASTMEVSDTEIGRNDSFNVDFQTLWNNGARTFTGFVGVVLCDESDKIACVIDSITATFNTLEGWGAERFTIDVPETVADGSYRLCFAYRAEGKSDYHVIRTPVGKPNYVRTRIEGDKIYFSGAEDQQPALRLDALEVVGNLYYDRNGRFRYTVTNDGGEYVSVLVLYMISATSENVYTLGSINPVVIAQGETQTFEVLEPVVLPEGEYYVYLYYDPYNSYETLQTVSPLGEGIPVTVLPTPETSEVNLRLNTPLSFADNSHVDGSDINMTVSITNQGDYFSHIVSAYVFPERGGESLGYVGYQTFTIDAGETRDLTLSGALTLDEGSYMLALFYYDENERSWLQFQPYEYSQLLFTLSGVPTAIDAAEMEKMTVYPNPAHDMMYVRASGEITDIEVYDLSGRRLLQMQPETEGEVQVPVAGLQAGTYMLMVRTEQEVKTTQFIKK